MASEKGDEHRWVAPGSAWFGRTSSGGDRRIHPPMRRSVVCVHECKRKHEQTGEQPTTGDEDVNIILESFAMH